jgi:hypothetical protein
MFLSLNTLRSYGADESLGSSGYKHFVPPGLNRLHFDYQSSGSHYRAAHHPD